jgi:hypothetical protein
MTFCNKKELIENKTHWLLRKNPPKSMKGIMSGGAKPSATWSEGAMQDIRYPNPTTTWVTWKISFKIEISLKKIKQNKSIRAQVRERDRGREIKREREIKC